MNKALTALTGMFFVSGVSSTYADDVPMVMCEQFAIEEATRIVMPTSRFDADFAPPHHAPRNIPIEVTVPDNAEAYIHFPIVQDGTYIIYSTDPDRIVALKKKSGDAIDTMPLDAPQACSDTLKGGMKADIELGELKGPVPIAIEFKKEAAETIRLIVSRDPIN